MDEERTVEQEPETEPVPAPEVPEEPPIAEESVSAEPVEIAPDLAELAPEPSAVAEESVVPEQIALDLPTSEPVEPPKKRRGRRTKAEIEAEAAAAKEKEPPKKRRGRRSKAEIEAEDTAAKAEEATAPKKHRGRRSKAEIEADAKTAVEQAKLAEPMEIAEQTKPAETTPAEAEHPTPQELNIFVEHAGHETKVSLLLDAAVALFKAARMRDEIKEVQLYVKPEDHAAYYVINDDFTGKVDF